MSGPPQVVVHDRVQAEAALAAAAELGCAIWLRSAPDAAGYAGVGYLKALGDLVGHEIVVDCGDDAGSAPRIWKARSLLRTFPRPRALRARSLRAGARIPSFTHRRFIKRQG
jgi:hypothetical protein